MESTRGIVVNVIHFTDSQYIAQIYTEKMGRLSVIYSNKRSAKKNRIVLQPLYLIEFQTNLNTRSEVKRAQDIRLFKPYISIPTNPQKIFINLFLAEVLSKTLIEQTPNQTLFEFCVNALLLFDRTESAWKNFHIVFLVHLMKHLGICPTFEMISSDPTIRKDFELVLSTPMQEFSNVSLTREKRNLLLSKILEHYKIFLPIGELTSHAILAKL